MITPAQIREKALRPWENGWFHKAYLSGDDFFPLEIRFETPSGRKISDGFAAVQAWMAELEENSKRKKGFGYTVNDKRIHHRLLGPQHLPDKILFETRSDWLRFIGKQGAFDQFVELVAQTRQEQPQLLDFIRSKPLAALAHASDWSRLLTVCRWFRRHPKPGLYLRQLDIPGVDTKFIETHKPLLTELLNWVLCEMDVDAQVTGTTRNGFERRFGLKYDPPLIRFRILDPRFFMDGCQDLTLPIFDMKTADFKIKTVFITENKINGLTFPGVPEALVIFGLGYGIELLADIHWLKEKNIFYWGDIDTHGFAMLSQMRSYFPQTRSLLMDSDTLTAHRDLWGQEVASKRFVGNLANLVEEETALLISLQENRFGHHVRLEQERIGYGHLIAALKELGFKN